MRLYVNKTGIINEYIKILSEELLNTTFNLKDDIDAHAGELGRTHGIADVEFKKINDRFRIFLKVNRALLADNYGTGSLMDINNPGLFSSFMLENWNSSRPRRAGVPIMGRPKGEKYTDLAGNERQGSGFMVGKNIENRIFRQKHGGWIEIKPIKPSHTIETAITWYYVDWLPSAVKRTIKRMNFSKYLTFK